MGQRAILNLGKGNLAEGFPSITAQLQTENRLAARQFTGSLPSAPELLDCLQRWRSQYQAFYRLADVINTNARSGEGHDLSFKVTRQGLAAVAKEFTQQLNQWLDEPDFHLITHQLRQQLDPQQVTRIILQTDHIAVQQLPWLSWRFLKDYRKAELSFCPLSFESRSVTKTKASEVRILGIFENVFKGNRIREHPLFDNGIPQAETVMLVAAQQQEVMEHLWSPQGWDMLFFSNPHFLPDSQNANALVNTTPQASLTLAQLRHGLTEAVECGLQLAIFNVENGLDLAQQLEDLHLPYVVVMREPAPPLVFQTFVQCFLWEFSDVQSFDLAVRKARDRLQGLEHKFPSASWLPVIFQNPIQEALTWKSLMVEQSASPLDLASPHDEDGQAQQAVTMVFTDLLKSTDLKNHLDGTTITERNQSYRDNILLPHRHRIQETLAQYDGRIVEIVGDAFFLVFPRPMKALLWAIAVQRSHRETPIMTPLGPLQMRIGMHTGYPLRSGEHFVGQEVDYAARVSTLAGGDDIYLSEVSAVLIRSAGIKGIQIRELGPQSLKGIGVVPIYEALYTEEALNPSPAETLPMLPSWWATGKNALQQHLPALLLSGLIASGFVMAVRWSGWLQAMELSAYDRLMRQVPTVPADRRILLVGADEDDISSKHYGYPLPDRILAQLIEKLQQYQPAAIGLDIARDQPVPLHDAEGHQAFVTQLANRNNVIAACIYGEKLSDSMAALPELSYEQVGFVDLYDDSLVGGKQDDTVRRYLLSRSSNALDQPSRCKSSYSFGWQLAFRYLQANQIEVTSEGENWLFGEAIAPPMGKRNGGYQTIDGRGNQLLIRYRNTEQLAQQVTIREILEESESFNPNWVTGRVVIVGVVAASVPDTHDTPYGEIRGLFVHAHAVSQLLSAGESGQKAFLWWWPQWVDALWVLLWATVAALIATVLQRWQYQIIALGILVALIYGMSWYGLVQGGWLALIPAILGSALAMFLVSLMAQIRESKQAAAASATVLQK